MVNGPLNLAWYGVRGRTLSSRGSAIVRSVGAATDDAFLAAREAFRVGEANRLERLAAELKGLAPTYDPVFAARNQPKQRSADASKAVVQPTTKPAAKSQAKTPSKPQRVAASPR